MEGEREKKREGGRERERSHFVVRLVAAIEADYNLMMAAKSVARSAKDMYSELKSHVCGNAYQIPMYIIIRIIQHRLHEKTFHKFLNASQPR